MAFGVQQLYFKTPSFDKEMMQAASEINKTCPVMIDEQTRLDNTVALPDNSFQYNYTLVNLTKAEINLDTVRKYLEPVIIKCATFYLLPSPQSDGNAMPLQN